MPTLYIKKGSTTYSITLYEKKPTNPALDIKYGGKTYYAGLSSDLSHANATPVRVSMEGVTYVLLTKTENPWIEANHKNGFSSTLVSNGTNNPSTWIFTLKGGRAGSSFRLKTYDGYIYPSRPFDRSGAASIDVYANFIQHQGNPKNEYWVQYI